MLLFRCSFCIIFIFRLRISLYSFWYENREGLHSLPRTKLVVEAEEYFFFRMFILFVFPLCRICKKYNSNNEEISPQTKWNLNCCGGGRNGMAYQRPANATGWRWKSDFPHAGSLITLEHTHTQHADNESRHLHRITALGAQHCNSASADRNFDSTSFCFFLFRETSWARIEANLIKTWFNQCTKN